MSDFMLKDSHLQGLRSVGYHLMSKAREDGGDTSKPLAFVGLVTVLLGATMLMKAMKQMEGRGR